MLRVAKGSFRLPAAPRSLAALNRIIAASKPPFSGAPKAVLGEGPIRALIAFVGEQRGDEEEKQGHPFVGPAGKLLKELMEQADTQGERVYLTNAVKHFKYEQRGKRRLHKRPTSGEIEHLSLVARSRTRFRRSARDCRLGRQRGARVDRQTLAIGAHRGETTLDGRAGYITVHPSALLRSPEAPARREARADFLADLKRIRALALSPSSPQRSGRRRSPAHAPPPDGS